MKSKFFLLVSIFIFLAFAASLYSLHYGEISFSIDDFISLLTGGAIEEYKEMIFYKLRIPRVVLGFFVGASLSLAGAVLQALFRNPLVEPYTLGISGGASIGVATAIVFSFDSILGSMSLPIMGFLGAFITLLLLYQIALKNRRIEINKVLLTGVMLSFISSSLMMLLLSIAKNEKLQTILFWTMGGLMETRVSLIILVVVLSLTTFIITLFLTPQLNAMRLGIEKAEQLGVNSHAIVRLLFLLSSLLTGVCVSIVGVIGFIGLIIPQLIRLIIGGDYRMLIPISFLAGGTFLILCDLVARTVLLPNELPVGVITGLIGGFVFVGFMMKSPKI